tara:strand:+ start:306 stop:530 length:225 start_codon:yes stop_codon:yes gene_type:complete
MQEVIGERLREQDAMNEGEVASLSWYNGKGEKEKHLSIRDLHWNAKVVAKRLRDLGLKNGKSEGGRRKAFTLYY